MSAKKTKKMSTGTKTKFKQPTKRSATIDTFQSGEGFIDERCFYYNKEQNVDESHIVRILSLDPEHAPTLNKVTCVKQITKDGALEDGNFAIPYSDECSEILDDAGHPMGDYKPKSSWLIPVFVFAKCNTKGQVVDLINELRYVEFGPGLSSDLRKMSEDVVKGTDFEAIPNYWVRIRTIKGTTAKYPKNYEIMPVTKIPKGSIIKTDLVLSNEEDLITALDEVFENAWTEKVEPEIDELIEHINGVVSTLTDPEAVKKQFKFKGEGPKEETTTRKRPTVGLRNRPTADPDEPEEVEEPEETEEPTEGKSRFSSLRKGGSRF